MVIFPNHHEVGVRDSVHGPSSGQGCNVRKVLSGMKNSGFSQRGVCVCACACACVCA